MPQRSVSTRRATGSQGLVDTASLYEVLALLSFDHFNDAYSWAQGQAIRLTAALAFPDVVDLRQVPSPGRIDPSAASGHYRKLTDRLLTENIVRGIEAPSQSVQESALRFVRDRYRDPANVKAVHKLVTEQYANDPTVQHWLYTMAHIGWQENIGRTGSLINRSLITQTAAVTGMRPKRVRELADEGSNWDDVKVKYVARLRPDSLIDDEFSLAYLASAVLRGVYHDKLASGSMRQLWLHPHRDAALPRLAAPEFVIVPSNVEQMFAWVILAKAQHRAHRFRIDSWVDGVKTARDQGPKLRSYLHKEGDPARLPEEEVLKRSRDAAHSLGIGVPKALAHVLEVGLPIAIAVGFGAVSELVFQNWLLAAGVGGVEGGVQYTTEKYVLRGVPKLTRAVSVHEHRVKSIIDKGPGRITMPYGPRVA